MAAAVTCHPVLFSGTNYSNRKRTVTLALSSSVIVVGCKYSSGITEWDLLSVQCVRFYNNGTAPCSTGGVTYYEVTFANCVKVFLFPSV